MIRLLKSGIIYLNGRDKHYRPILIVKAEKFMQMKPVPNNEDLITLALWFFEFMETYMMVPGRIENVILIIDCKNLSVFSAPYGMLKAVLGVVTSQYKCKSRCIYVVNSPKTFSVVWKVVKNLIDECTAAKVNIISENTCP